MKKAREMFMKWYLKKPGALGDIISTMKEEIIETGESKWVFTELLDVCGDIPDDIAQALKYEGYLDDEMRSIQADMEAQDHETFGGNKI